MSTRPTQTFLCYFKKNKVPGIQALTSDPAGIILRFTNSRYSCSSVVENTFTPELLTRRFIAKNTKEYQM